MAKTQFSGAPRDSKGNPLPRPKAKVAFKRQGYLCVRLAQSGRVCLYQCTNIGAGCRPHWEVHVMQWRVDRYGERWGAPSNTQWGRYGWTLMSHARAVEKFTEQCELFPNLWLADEEE